MKKNLGDQRISHHAHIYGNKMMRFKILTQRIHILHIAEIQQQQWSYHLDTTKSHGLTDKQGEFPDSTSLCSNDNNSSLVQVNADYR